MKKVSSRHTTWYSTTTITPNQSNIKLAAVAIEKHHNVTPQNRQQRRGGQGKGERGETRMTTREEE